MQMNIRSMITGNTVKPGQFEHSWQHFVIERQEAFEEKLNTTPLSPNYIEEDNKLHDILESIKAVMGEEKFDEVYRAILNKETTVSYLHYNKGFFDGIKFALMAGQL